MKKIITILFFLLIINNKVKSQINDSDPDVSYIKVDSKINYENVRDSIINHDKTLHMIFGKQYNNAIELLRKEININPNNAYAISLLGLAYNESGFPDKSLTYFDKALEMIPNQYEFHYNRGLAYYRLQQFQRAIEDYSITITNHPNDSLAFYNRALAYEGIRDFLSAIKDYNVELKINGDRARTYNNRGRCYMIIKEYKLALKDFNKALEIEPTKANAYGNRGVLYLRMEQPEKACSDLYKATELGDDYSTLINNYCK